jgi:hypothetical protein
VASGIAMARMRLRLWPFGEVFDRFADFGRLAERGW